MPTEIFTVYKGAIRSNSDGVLLPSEACRTIRNKFDKNAEIFGAILGVSKRTVEGWEQGRNPSAAQKRLGILIGMQPKQRLRL